MPLKPRIFLPYQRGVGLLEILVAVLVLSIGLLGLAGLQIQSMRFNHSAYQRSQATVLAYDIADRMRANRKGVEDGEYHGAATNSNNDCAASSCTPAAMADYDVTQWTQALNTYIPGGSGTVCLDATPEDGTPGSPECDGSGDVYAIKVWWNDDRDPDADPEEEGEWQRFITALEP